jgi:hypothetical protein
MNIRVTDRITIVAETVDATLAEPVVNKTRAAAGHWTCSPLPTWELNCALNLHRARVKIEVIPELSSATTMVIAAEGRESSGFVSAIAESFQFVMFPRKICANASRVSTSCAETPGMLNTGATAIAITGNI